MREESWRREPSAYGEQMDIAPRYVDIDVMQHLNNVAVGSIHQEARMRWLMAHVSPGAWRAEGVQLRPRVLVTDFLGEGRYPAAIEAGVRCLGVDAHGCDMATALFQQEACFGTQQVRLAAWHEGLPIALPGALRDTLGAAVNALPEGDVPTLAAQQPPALADFAWTVELQSRFGDMDADGQAGELALSRYVETARILGVRDGLPALHEALQAEGMGLVVGRVSLDIFRQRHPGRGWQAGVRIARLGNASFTVECALFARDTCIALSQTVLVSIHRQTRRAQALPASVREAMSPLLSSAMA